jgi:hypothetical protein
VGYITALSDWVTWCLVNLKILRTLKLSWGNTTHSCQRKLLHKIASEHNEEQRVAFLHSIQNDFSGMGNKFVIVNESSKNEHDVACWYGHAPRGHTADFSDPFVHGQWYSLVTAMSKCGYIATHIIPGLLDSFAFFDFIVEDVVSVMAFCSLMLSNPHSFLKWSHFLTTTVC